ncbi:hypothetical protein GJ698_03370 [Pseudoduganella sp. FT26W]|uniref:Uncharacterized protein n=1 Tax=Duganella aquatilis TaxID=2666082 RepID=A0A844D7B6_9BURK|nr:hypothetical protein [Duganella aquatilis]MRW83129.1 hypothetical protein [Duganella aquatilis]
MSVQIDTDTLLRLISQLKLRGGTQDISEAITSAIELWLREQAGLAKGSDPANLRGYQWKSLFLPDGTELRSWSYGEHNYARVVGDQIIHQGQPITPNQFAQKFARSFRNAWMDISVRRPEDKQFIIADRLRREQATPPRAPAPAEPSLPQLMAALQAQLQAQQPTPPVPAPAPAPTRDTTPGEGWTLPERRKFRFRLEDVAFE